MRRVSLPPLVEVIDFTDDGAAELDCGHYVPIKSRRSPEKAREYAIHRRAWMAKGGYRPRKRCAQCQQDQKETGS